MQYVETGSAASLALDAVAGARKGRALLGSKTPYASGFNMIGREIARAWGRPGLIPKVTAIGDRVTPVLAVTGALTVSYNTTIDIQCRLGIIN